MSIIKVYLDEVTLIQKILKNILIKNVLYVKWSEQERIWFDEQIRGDNFHKKVNEFEKEK